MILINRLKILSKRILTRFLPNFVRKYIIIKKKLSIRKWYNPKYTDVIILSFPKAGRTWLRLMIGEVIKEHFKITKDDVNLLDLYSLTEYNYKIPRIQVTHDDLPYFKKPSELNHNKRKFSNVKVILMVRDPRDIIVSLFFHMKYRYKYYNDRFYEGNINEFIHEDIGSYRTLIEYYKIWYNNIQFLDNVLLVKYEDLCHDTKNQIIRILNYLGLENVSNSIINDTLQYTSFKNMQKIERENRFKSNTLKTLDKHNKNSYKTRKGKIGGYKEYFSNNEIEYLNEIMRKEFPKFYGYNI